jgi:hypothetical protein
MRLSICKFGWSCVLHAGVALCCLTAFNVRPPCSRSGGSTEKNDWKIQPSYFLTKIPESNFWLLLSHSSMVADVRQLRSAISSKGLYLASYK